jgi:hypothetical protein
LSEEKDYPTKGWAVNARLPLDILFGGKKPRKAVLDTFDNLNPHEQLTVDLAVFYLVRDKKLKYNPKLTSFERSHALSQAAVWIVQHQYARMEDLHHMDMYDYITVRFPRWSLEAQAK